MAIPQSAHWPAMLVTGLNLSVLIHQDLTDSNQIQAWATGIQQCNCGSMVIWLLAISTGCDDPHHAEEDLKHSLLLWCTGANTR